MKTSFFLIVNPIIAIFMSLLFYTMLSSIVQGAATVHIGLLLFFVIVMPCYVVTIACWHFQKNRWAVYSFFLHIFISCSIVYYLLSKHFLSMHLPLDVVKHLMISFVFIGFISLYGVFISYIKIISRQILFKN